LQDIPKSQKQSPPKPLSYYEGKYSEKKRAMAEAYCSGGYTLPTGTNVMDFVMVIKH